MRWLLSSVVLGSVLVACSGAGDNPLTTGGGGGNSGTDGGGGDGGNNTDSGLGPCDAKCTINVPNGFKLVAAGDRNLTCPQGFTSHDVVADAKVSDGACGCECNMAQQPTCNTGTIVRTLDQTTNATCGTNATPITITGQQCSVLPNYINATGAHYNATLPPTGGMCSWTPKTDPQKVMARQARICDVPPSCQGSVCGAKSMCVVTDGDVACPPTFPTKTLLGGSATADCAACGDCKIEATCTGTLSLYQDYNCMTGKTDYPIDGSCNKNPAQNVNFFAFSTSTSLGKSNCAGPAPTPAGTVKLTTPQTMCCTQ